MSFLNDRIASVKPSATLAVKEKASALRAEGRDIINLGPGEPDIDTPDHIKEAAKKALDQGKTKYLAVAGLPELKEAIADKFARENNIPTQASDVIVTAGGKQALFECFNVCLQPGDEVIIPAPYWVSYPEMVRLCGAVPKILPSRPENAYKLTPQELEAAITDKTKFFVLNSPSNPSGAAYTELEQKALGEVLKNKNVVTISDEVYEKIVFDGFEFKSFAAVNKDIADRVVTINACSKTYSMTGWRLGYATGPAEIIKAMSRHQGQSTSNACSIAQYAALAALTGTHDFLDGLLGSYTRRRKYVCDQIDQSPHLTIPQRPEGAFYVFARIENIIGRSFQGKKINNSTDFCEFLLEQASVAVVPGGAFGDDAAFRISYAVSDEVIERAFFAMSAALNELE
ncbi:MAG: pyridoxal phosphate-dependent aminotransferase [Deltaproteobacteria bacterium]|nr:pyridoxal phosphate-dependent aminotransferase [Deltaproteobacteria bacterium]